MAFIVRRLCRIRHTVAMPALLALLALSWAAGLHPVTVLSASEAMTARTPGPLPAVAITRHQIEQYDETLKFEARAGAITLAEDRGEERAEIGFVAYLLNDEMDEGEGARGAARPVTFAVNGGPRCGIGLSAYRGARSVAAADERRSHQPVTGYCTGRQRRNLARLHGSGFR